MCEDLPTWAQWLIPILVLIIEAYLGKTTRTKSGSMLEWIFNTVRRYLKYRGDKANE